MPAAALAETTASAPLRGASAVAGSVLDDREASRRESVGDACVNVPPLAVRRLAFRRR